MSEILQPHGGHASEGYGRPKSKGQILAMGSHFIWKKSVSGLMLSVP